MTSTVTITHPSPARDHHDHHGKRKTSGHTSTATITRPSRAAPARNGPCYKGRAGVLVSVQGGHMPTDHRPTRNRRRQTTRRRPTHRPRPDVRSPQRRATRDRHPGAPGKRGTYSSRHLALLRNRRLRIWPVLADLANPQRKFFFREGRRARDQASTQTRRLTVAGPPGVEQPPARGSDRAKRRSMRPAPREPGFSPICSSKFWRAS